MKILVTGGTGTLGNAFVKAVIDAGHQARVMSRRARPTRQLSGHEWSQADLATGEGISEAVSGVDAVMHGATSPGFGAKKVDVEGTRRLVEASAAAGVEHFIYPSIVGVDEIPFSYYQQKLKAEWIVEEGAVPYTILRATQFHAFVDQIISAGMRLPFVGLLPTDFQMQSVAAAEVAARLRRCLEEGPARRLEDFGGPEVLRIGEMARSWMQAREKQKWLLRLPLPGQTAKAFREGKNTNPDQTEGEITWREWLNR